MINIIFDPSQITNIQAMAIGTFALLGALATTSLVVEATVTVLKKIFRSPVKNH